MRILVTGGTGVLGRHVVERLRGRGDKTAVLTRRSGVPGGVPGDLATGAGLDAACRGAEGVIHLATAGARPGQARTVDVEGTARLADAAARQGVGHLLYISILGVDRIPYGYYAAKLAAEHELRRAGPVWTVLRLAQFHELLDAMFRVLGQAPILPLPRGLSVQPLAARDAARVVAETFDRGPSTTVLAAGGPQILTLKEAAEQWIAARHEAGGRNGAVLELPAGGAAMRALRAGHNLVPESMQPGIVFGDWSRERFLAGEGSAYRRR